MIDDGPSHAFVGRERELEQVAAVIAAGGDDRLDGALVVGEAGCGSTWLARRAVRLAIDGGRRAVRLTPGHARAQDGERPPYEAWLGVLAGTDLHSTVGGADAVVVLRHICHALAGPEPTIVFVDDAHLLDDDSCTMLLQAIRAGVAVLVATSRPERLGAPSMQVIDRTLRLHRCDLRPFDRSTTGRFVEQLLGDPVDGLTITALHDATGGVPLAISEVARKAVADGAIRLQHGLLHLDGTLRSTPVLRTTALAAIDGLSPEATRLLKTIAIAGSVPLEPFESSDALASMLELDAGRLISDASSDPGRASGAVVRHAAVTVRRPDVRLALVDEMSMVERRALLRQLAQIVERQPGGRSTHALELAAWRVGAGLPADVELLIAGAREAKHLHDFRTVAMLSELAITDATNLEMVLLHAEALHELGAFAGADALLVEATARVTDGPSRVRLAIARHRVLLWGRQRADESRQVLADIRRELSTPEHHDLLCIAEANVLAFDAHPAEALAAIAATDSSNDVLAVAAAFPGAIAHMYQGRIRLAIDEAAAAIEARASLGAHADGLAHPLLDHLAHGLARFESGRFDVAYADLVEGHDIAVRDNMPQLIVWFALSAGRVAMHQGRVRTALRHFVESRSICERISFVTGRRIAMTATIICAHLLGEHELAVRAEAELLAAGEDIGFLAAETYIGLAHGRAAAGDDPGAVDALLAGAAFAGERGEHLFELENLWELARLGHPELVHDRIVAAGRAVDGELSAARVLASSALVERDPDQLLAASAAFDRCGAQLVAAELAERAAELLQAAGAARAAGRAMRIASLHRDRCEGAVAFVAMRSIPVIELSEREQEVAELAAEGRSSKEIAAALIVSVRTVSNHLQNIYLRCGISSRAELIGLLRDDPTLLQRR